ncbi:Transcriptional regulator, LuxR family [Croceitalea dokdonensis DOKDO 023]|uniref:Transcriptional regulator, LuxR family n=1 Tax=Croceitalea dokdonensis DOKDO 023 TaxID=1300341 RepID=A0A0N8H3Z9_9FLAO|nr:helix-turn-helix transcriptional regulator [Croceitalea dokdonensis]KPM31980.1 Transcriptional regulator, LuxR family [Croceitalea dokdonensis DOKDO 023]
MVESMNICPVMAIQITANLNMLWKDANLVEVQKNEFTGRELEIIQLIAKGLNSYEIADRLYISKHTVDTHRKNIYRKGRFRGVREVILFSLMI